MSQQSALAALKPTEKIPLVHNIETTLHFPRNQPENEDYSKLPSSFHDYIRDFDIDEYIRTETLYAIIDCQDGKNRSDLLQSCRTRAWFARHSETHEIRVVSNQCRLRWCPLCARARSRFIVTQISGYLKDVKAPKFLTLTLKHSNAPLAHQVKNLYNYFVKFRRLKEIKKAFRGGIWFFQIHKSKRSGQWHPHLHCLIDADYIFRGLLSRLWQKTTLGSNVIDIRKVKDEEHAAEYVSRDCARPCRLENLGVDDQVELYHALNGRRLCGTWGNAKTVELKTKKIKSDSKWQKIGEWGMVNYMRTEHPDAEKIIKAFLTGKPLDEDIDFYHIEEFIAGKIDEVAKKAETMYLEFQ